MTGDGSEQAQADAEPVQKKCWSGESLTSIESLKRRRR